MSRQLSLFFTILISATAVCLCVQLQDSLLSVPHLYEAGQRNVRFRYGTVALTKGCMRSID